MKYLLLGLAAASFSAPVVAQAPAQPRQGWAHQDKMVDLQKNRRGNPNEAIDRLMIGEASHAGASASTKVERMSSPPSLQRRESSRAWKAAEHLLSPFAARARLARPWCDFRKGRPIRGVIR